MGKLLVIAAIVLVVYRMLLGRWPWEKRPTPSDRRLASARKLLSVSKRAGRSDILAAHRRRVAEVHPDRGGSPARVHEADEARDLLLTHLPPPILQDPKEPT